ncbi:MAG: S-layer homology domain-containing protein [Veillonella sp.]|uniref:S-layer homology domain-containing protein n=1 Tax=Veillonella sp. TaxID=1926307 RepID=UPI0025D2E8A8|nr:S-layer homology domain-containing protein [Veillonella sp.]MBS4912957.1 S-layer homology domain-containing protein [Veillonella sp.]
MSPKTLRLAVLAATFFTSGLYSSVAFGATDATAATTSAADQNVTAVSSLVNTDGSRQVVTKTPTAADQEAAQIAAARNEQTIAAEKVARAQALEEENKITFSDVKNHWAKPYINDFVKSGILSGNGQGEFSPDAPLTVKDATSLFDKLIITTKTDIANNKTAKKATNTKNSDKNPAFVPLDKNGSILMADFKGDTNLSRQEFASAAASYARYQQDLEDAAKGMTQKQHDKARAKEAKAEAANAALTFEDSADISADYQKDVAYLAHKGYIASGSAVEFRPADFITRAEAVAMLYRIKHNETAPVVTATAAQDTDAVTTVNTGKTASDTTKATDSKTNSAATAKDTKATKADAAESAHVSLENRVFKKLNTLYKTPANFQNYGVMYWQDNQLHVALKNSEDLDTLTEKIDEDTTVDKTTGKTLKDSVVLESTQYSQVEYDRIEANFRKFYAQKQPQGTVLSAYPSVTHNQLIVTVNKTFDYMNDSIKNAFGDKVHVFVLES